MDLSRLPTGTRTGTTTSRRLRPPGYKFSICRPRRAKKVAQLISTTDGIIFYLWSDDEKVPSGRVVIPQSVGHVNLTEFELKDGAKESVNVSKK
jgi:hypothetical protein